MYKLSVIIISVLQVAKPRVIEVKEICEKSHRLLSGGVKRKTRAIWLLSWACNHHQ